jgi:hypothetical protein
MLKRTTAKSNRKQKKSGKLRSDERERVQDTMQLVQSARDSLSEVDPSLIPDRKAIEECFDLTGRSLREVLDSK